MAWVSMLFTFTMPRQTLLKGTGKAVESCRSVLRNRQL